MNRACRSCGTSIEHRAVQAIYCEVCGTDHRARKPVKEALCDGCGGALNRSTPARFCMDCARARSRKSTSLYLKNSPKAKRHAAAREITNKAVQVGFLVDPKELACMDCGRPAKCYDHRDYNNPLKVEPVCIPCNSSRGAGKAWGGKAKAKVKARVA